MSAPFPVMSLTPGTCWMAPATPLPSTWALDTSTQCEGWQRLPSRFHALEIGAVALRDFSGGPYIPISSHARLSRPIAREGGAGVAG